jgi:hypothetical protein
MSRLTTHHLQRWPRSLQCGDDGWRIVDARPKDPDIPKFDRTFVARSVSTLCHSAFCGSPSPGLARRGEKIAKAIGRRSHTPYWLLVATGEFD